MKYLPLLLGILLLVGVVSAGPPIVNFTSNVTKGYPPLSVQFNDTSYTTITGWNWSYTNVTPGNNTQYWWSTGIQNVTNTFGTGNWKINLNVTNASGSNTSAVLYYINVSPSGGLSGWNRQDVLLTQVYSVTVNCKDAVSLQFIPVCTFIDSNNNTVNTTMGTYTFTYGYSRATVYAFATGYNSNSASFIVDHDQTQDIFLTKESKNAQNTWWTPHTVQITLMDDTYANRLTDVNISATYNESSMPTTWISDLYGIQNTPAGDMVNSALVLGGKTGSDGTLTATMLGSLKYDITLNSVKYGLTNYRVQAYPSDPMLNIYVPTNLAPSFTNTSNSIYAQLNGTSVYVTEPDIYNVSMCINYVDTAGKTSSVNETWLYANNNTVIFNQNITISGVTPNLTCITKPNVKGMQVWWGYNATRSV